MTILDLRPRLASARRDRFAARFGLPPIPAKASKIYAANLRLASLPLMLTYVWLDEMQRYTRILAQAS